MEDNINQAADATNSDEELDFELDLNDTEDVEALRSRIEKVEQFARTAAARAKKAEKELKNSKSAPQINNQEPAFKIDDETLDLRLDGYTRDEVEFIARNGGRKALNDKSSFTSIAINTIREQKKAEAAASQTADTSGMSEIERKYTPEMMRNMSLAELEKIVPRA